MPVQPSDQEEEGSHPIAGLFGILISPSVRRGVAKTPTGPDNYAVKSPPPAALRGR
jgi:hypothetical protein